MFLFAALVGRRGAPVEAQTAYPSPIGLSNPTLAARRSRSSLSLPGRDPVRVIDPTRPRCQRPYPPTHVCVLGQAATNANDALPSGLVRFAPARGHGHHRRSGESPHPARGIRRRFRAAPPGTGGDAITPALTLSNRLVAVRPTRTCAYEPGSFARVAGNPLGPAAQTQRPRFHRPGDYATNLTPAACDVKSHRARPWRRPPAKPDSCER